MVKKGQVSLFIIIGLVILIVLGILTTLYFSVLKEKLGVEREKSVEFTTQANLLKSSLQQCFEKTTSTEIQFIGLQGGYYLSNQPSISYLTYDIPYYNQKLPTKESIEKELNNALISNLPACVNSAKENTAFTIQSATPVVKTKISENGITANVVYNIKLEKDNSVSDLNKFSISVPVKLYKYYLLNKELLQQQPQNGMCLSCIANLAAQNNLKIDVLSTDNPTEFILAIEDNSTQIDNTPYLFLSAYKINDEN